MKLWPSGELANAYVYVDCQVLGHFAANLDPLGFDEKKPPEQLEPEFYGFTEKDLERE